MERKVKVILNEQHQLLPDQVKVLNEEFGPENWDILPVPARGWTWDEQVKVAESLKGENVVFASPVPVLLKILAKASGQWSLAHEVGFKVSDVNVGFVFVFHNDNREAKEIELPDGTKKVIHTVAKTGWVLV